MFRFWLNLTTDLYLNRPELLNYCQNDYIMQYKNTTIENIPTNVLFLFNKLLILCCIINLYLLGAYTRN
jgi:hypothetical protein